MSPADDEPSTSDMPYLSRLTPPGRIPPLTPPTVGGEVRRGVGWDSGLSGPSSTAVNVGEVGPLLRSGPVESKLTKVARVFAIVRDFLIILLIVAALVLGAKVIQGVGDGLRGVPAATPAPCATPVVDGYGTFCPETPGG